MWIRNIFSELKIELGPTPIHIDNQGTIQVIKNVQVHSKTEHIDIKLFFIRDAYKDKKIAVDYVKSEEDIADIFTKALPPCKFEKLRSLSNLRGESQELEANLCEEMGNFKLPLLFIAGLIAQADSFLLGPDKTVRENEVMLSYGNPCEYMLEVNLQQEIDHIHDTFAAEEKTGSTFCRSEKLYQFGACILESRKLSATIAQFPQIARKITKRDIIDDFVSGFIKLPKIVLAAATTWIKSTSKTTIVDLLLNVSKESLSELMNVGHTEYQNMTIVPYNVTKEEITRVSLFAQKHPEILDDAINNARDLHGFLDYLSDEFIAAEILLASIYKMLKKGHVDTESLGELAGSQLLMEMDPLRTKLREVLDVREMQAVKFVFDVIRDVPFFERIIMSDLLISCIILVMIALLGVLVSLSFGKNRTSSRRRPMDSKQRSGPDADDKNQSLVDIDWTELETVVKHPLKCSKTTSSRKASGPRGDEVDIESEYAQAYK